MREECCMGCSFVFLLDKMTFSAIHRQVLCNHLTEDLRTLCADNVLCDWFSHYDCRPPLCSVHKITKLKVKHGIGGAGSGRKRLA